MKILFRLTLVMLSSLLICSIIPFLTYAQLPVADISLTKTASDTSVLSGSTVSYLYNVTNIGETALTGSIYDDAYGTVGNYVNLQPGGWVGFNVSHTLTQSTLNNATAYGVDSYGANVTATASAYVEVIQPTIKVTKTGTPKIQPAPGVITWNVTVKNTGQAPVTAVNVTDSQHGYLGSIGTLNPGQTVFFVIVESSLPIGTYANNATAYAYYEPSDSIISDSDCDVCYVKHGFIIPEVPYGTLMISAAMFIGLASYYAIPKVRTKKRQS